MKMRAQEMKELSEKLHDPEVERQVMQDVSPMEDLPTVSKSIADGNNAAAIANKQKGGNNSMDSGMDGMHRRRSRWHLGYIYILSSIAKYNTKNHFNFVF